MRQANTGGWLFERSQFKDWVKEQSNSRLLWGYGIRTYNYIVHITLYRANLSFSGSRSWENVYKV